MVPRPLEQEAAGPDRSQPPASSGRRHAGFGRRRLDPGAAAGGGVALSQVTLKIEDGLLMALGPDGDPLPPAVFAAAAQEQPAALVRLSDGTPVAPTRAAAVLQAQAKGPVADRCEGAAAAERWIRSMLGLGPQPATASAAELEDERRVCELTAFARELMIGLPAGATFLITEAAGPAAASAGLVLPDGTRIAVACLIERIRAELCPPPAPRQTAAGAAPPAAEVALSECRIRRAGAGVVLELPSIGAVRLIDLPEAAPEGPRVGLFRASGAPATVADLAATLGPARPAESGLDEPAPARAPSAGDTMVLSLDWPEIIEAAADGTADLGMLGAALEACGAQLPSATVVGLPAGAALSAGRRHDDGSWSLAAEDLRGLQLRLPAAAPGDLALEITVRALQGEAIRTLAVRHSPRPQPPAAAAPPRPQPAAAAAAKTAAAPGAGAAPCPQPAAIAAAQAVGAPGAGATPIRLAVRLPAGAGINPKDIALVILGGVPQGAALSAGIDNGDGSWMLSTQDLVGLELSLPAGCPADLTLEVTALAVTSREGEMARAGERLRLSLGAAARPVPLVIDQAAAQGLQALMIRDLPAGARLSAGTYDPAIDAWVVLPRQLDGLCVIPALVGSAFTLTVMGLARAADGRAETRLVTRLPVAAA